MALATHQRQTSTASLDGTTAGQIADVVGGNKTNGDAVAGDKITVYEDDALLPDIWEALVTILEIVRETRQKLGWLLIAVLLLAGASVASTIILAVFAGLILSYLLQAL
jgi:hypothetical protein